VLGTRLSVPQCWLVGPISALVPRERALRGGCSRAIRENRLTGDARWPRGALEEKAILVGSKKCVPVICRFLVFSPGSADSAPHIEVEFGVLLQKSGHRIPS